MPATNHRGQYLKNSRYFKQLVGAYENTPAVRISIELLLSLITISFFALFALRPTLNTISELVAQIRSQEEIKGKLEQKITNLGQAQAIWAKEQERIILVGQALPPNPNIDAYIKQIEGIAVSRGLSLTFFGVDETVLKGENKDQKKKGAVKGIENIEASVSLSGSYSSLVLFVEDLEKLRRPVELISISFSLTRVGQGQSNLLLTISNEVPYYGGKDQ